MYDNPGRMQRTVITPAIYNPQIQYGIVNMQAQKVPKKSTVDPNLIYSRKYLPPSQRTVNRFLPTMEEVRKFCGGDLEENEEDKIEFKDQRNNTSRRSSSSASSGGEETKASESKEKEDEAAAPVAGTGKKPVNKDDPGYCPYCQKTYKSEKVN